MEENNASGSHSGRRSVNNMRALKQQKDRKDMGFFESILEDISIEVDQMKRELVQMCGINREAVNSLKNVKPMRKLENEEVAASVAASAVAREDGGGTGFMDEGDPDYEFMKALEKQAMKDQLRTKELELEQREEELNQKKIVVSKREERLSKGDVDSSCNGSEDTISASGGSASILSPPDTPIDAQENVKKKRTLYSKSTQKSKEEETLLETIEYAEYLGDELGLAEAYANLAFYYCNVQGRPWKAMDFLKEAWRLYKKNEDKQKEANFLSDATPCMVKARQTNEAILMAERRSELLNEIDPIAANEALVFALDLKKQRNNSETVRRVLGDMTVERPVAFHEMDPLLQY